MIEGVYDAWDPAPYLEGKLAPVFFGSAVNNFGVQEMLDTFVDIAPNPKPRETSSRMVAPDESKFTGFIFKIHANIDPKHRDRIAFLRVCSGNFERNTFYQHTRLDKKLKFANPASFLAQEKSVVEQAWPGDVVGLYDTGNFKIGDTLTEGEDLQFRGIPSFSPEIFKELVNKDPMKSKQLEKGIQQLTDEGVAQLFIREAGNRKIVGTVGELPVSRSFNTASSTSTAPSANSRPSPTPRRAGLSRTTKRRCRSSVASRRKTSCATKTVSKSTSPPPSSC